EQRARSWPEAAELAQPGRARGTRGAHPLVPHGACQVSSTRSRMGVGLNELHGFRSCGQADSANSDSISTDRTSRSPGLLSGGWLPKLRSGWIGAFWKKLMVSGISHSSI